jgi:hypothetical protein
MLTSVIRRWIYPDLTAVCPGRAPPVSGALTGCSEPVHTNAQSPFSARFAPRSEFSPKRQDLAPAAY